MIDLLRSWVSWSMFGLHIGWWKSRHTAAERALVFVRQGVFYDLVLACRIYVGELGEIFAYGSNGIVYVFNKERAKLTREESEKLLKAETKEDKRLIKRFEPEKMEVYEDERLLFVVDGEVVASPLVGTGVPMEQDLLSDFNRGDAMKQALESLRDPNKGTNWGSMKWLLVIVGIVIIVFIIWKFVLKGHMPGAVTVPTPTPTPTPTPNTGPIFSAVQWVLWGLINA